MVFMHYFTRMRVALWAAAFLLIAAIWTVIVWRIDFESRKEMDSIVRYSASLTRAFEESVRNDMSAIEDILTFLKTEYERHGSVTSEMLALMKSARTSLSCTFPLSTSGALLSAVSCRSSWR